MPSVRGATPLTGGGLVAALDPDRGIVGVWQDRCAIVGSIELRLDGRRAEALRDHHGQRGSWRGRYEVADGLHLVERGCLPDAIAAVVFEWTLELSKDAPEAAAASASNHAHDLKVRFDDPEGRGFAEIVTRIVQGRPTVFALLAPGVPADRAERMLAALGARQRQRCERWHEPGVPPFTIVHKARPDAQVEHAVRTIDDSPLAFPPGSFFLDGLGAEGPSYLQAGALAEVGLGALLSGRHSLSRHILGVLTTADDATPVAVLNLAARYALWTGNAAALLPLMPRLEMLSIVGERRGPSPSSSGLREAILLLSSAVEPLGDRSLTERLKALGEAVAPPLASLSSSPHAHASRSVVVEGGGAGGAVRAARLIRRWIVDTLGAQPDAAYGRLRIAPRVTGLGEGLSVAGLRVGDASIRFDFERVGARYEFGLEQEGGRVPVNLIFAPRIDARSVEAVLIDDRPAEVEVSSRGSGTSLRLQLPLDRLRRLSVHAGEVAQG